MPRKSAIAHLTANVAIAKSRAQLEPPADLTAEQREDWLRFANRLAKALAAADVAPLLTELSRHMAYSRQLSEALDKERHCALDDHRHRAVLRDLLKMHERESVRITALMTKLRLTPQDCERVQQADRRRLREPSAHSPKPWELDALELEPDRKTLLPPEPEESCN
ncbi:MAG TPA: hypothetical protein VGJ20_25380 [Xanthobacteraceae bacterium]|jgi:hypothetical protein